MDDTTRLGTIWSQTLMDILCTAVRQNRDRETQDILREMRQKRYTKQEIRKYAAKNLEAGQVAFLERQFKVLG